MLRQAVFFIFLALLLTEARAELETGLGISAVHVPHYAGSDEAEVFVLPFPYIRYRSEKLSVDRNLIQGNLWKSGNWNLEISLGGAVRVESDNNEAREGMDDLDFIAEAGPALQYYFSGDRLNDNALFLTLPVRSAISTDFTDISARGFTFNPTLTWRRGYSSDHRLIRPQITFGLRSASDAYHHYIYGVDRRFETNSREEYDGEAGYGGFTLSYSTSIRWKDYLLAGFARYSNISGAVFEDSSLVRQNENFLFGAAFAYLF